MSRTRRVTVWVTGPIIMNLTKALANAREAESVSGRPLPRMRLSLCPMDRETGEGRVSARTAPHRAPHRAPHSPRPGSLRQGRVPRPSQQVAVPQPGDSPTSRPSSWNSGGTQVEFPQVRDPVCGFSTGKLKASPQLKLPQEKSPECSLKSSWPLNVS